MYNFKTLLTCVSLLEKINSRFVYLLVVIFLLSITVGAGERFLKTGDFPLLTALSAGHALHVFVNGQLAGNIKTKNQSLSSFVT